MSATVYVVANQKGGVAKTTTTVSLAAALTERDQTVLVVDLDPQAALTFALGYDPDGLARTVHDVVTSRADLVDVILQHPETDLAPANIDLAGAEVALLARTGREYVLRAQLDPLRDTYDTILIDCPPSLGVLTLNGLTAADRVLVPLQCETLSHRAVSQLLETIADVQRFTNRDLSVAGIVPTLYDARTRHSRDVLADVRRRYRQPVFEPPVRKSVRFAEAPNAGMSILAYDDSVPGAAAYRAVAARLAGLRVPERLLHAAGSPGRVTPPGGGAEGGGAP